MKQAIVYLRVSTEEQVKGASLDTQLMACQAWASNNGIGIMRTFREEGASAKTIKRPVLKQLIEYLEENGDQINYMITYQWDRFSRHVDTHAELKRILKPYGIETKDASSPLETNAASRLVENVSISFAQFDNEVKGERVLENMKTKAKLGFRMHMAPIGLTNSRDLDNKPTLIPNPVSGPLITKLINDYSTGAYTLTELVKKGRQLGVKTDKGNPITIQLFSKVLRNPIYAGWEKSSLTEGKLIKSSFEGVISFDTYEKNQRLLRTKNGTKDYVLDRDEYPLKRFIKCGICHTSITGSASTGRSGDKYAYYRCRTCSKTSTKITDLEDQFIELLDRISPRNELSAYIKKVILRTWNDEAKSILAERKIIENRSNELETKRQKALDAFLSGKITESEKNSYCKSIDNSLNEIEIRKTQSAEFLSTSKKTVDYAIDAISNVSKLWQDSSYDAKRKIQSATFPKGVEYDFYNKKFGTAELSPLYRYVNNQKESPVHEDSSMVIPKGVEPLLPD